MKKPETEYYAIDTLYWHFMFWRFLGLDDTKWPKRYQRILYKMYMVFIQFAVNFYFPFSLIYKLFTLRTPRDILENIAISFAVMTCSVKSIVMKRKITDIRKIGEISKELEKEAKLNEGEYELILEFKKKGRRYVIMFFLLFGSLVCSGALTVTTFTSRRLMYPAYFPYDFQQNQFIYGCTAFYQWLTWAIDVIGNAYYDSYPGLLTFLLCQHLKMLSLRVSKIGYDPKVSPEENQELLKKAVNVHRQLLQFYKTTNNAISTNNFILFLSSSFNIVCCVVVMCFFADNVYQKLYFINLIICYAAETALSCYFGSEFEDLIYNFTNSLYNCNWYEQPKNFKKDITIFFECSLRKSELMAAGLIPVNKETFVRVVKGTFSLFTVLNGMRKKFN